jgi:ubiquinone/menaquinone biosynthesis C-methylase UbiE
MEKLRQYLLQNGYVRDGGFYSRTEETGGRPSEAEAKWSNLGEENPVNAAAAASRDADWFVKFPSLVGREIADEDRLWLDAGCGYGRVAIPLLRNNRRVKIVGVDASRVMLEKFSELIKNEPRKDAYSRLLLLHSTINQLPMPDDYFDGIYSCAVLLHNPYVDVKNILEEFRRMLKPGGRLILCSSFPNLWNPEGAQNWIYSRFLARRDANGPVRPYTRRQAESLFADWSEARIIPSGAIVLPRQIGKFSLPGGNWIRKVNHRADANRALESTRAWLGVQYYDVIARK